MFKEDWQTNCSSQALVWIRRDILSLSTIWQKKGGWISHVSTPLKCALDIRRKYFMSCKDALQNLSLNT